MRLSLQPDMIRILLLAPLFAAATLAGANPPAPPAAADLFNGRDLSGWVNVNGSPTTWTVGKDSDGTPFLQCSGKPTGVLRTERQYENFILEMEWMHEEEPGNAGLFLWSDPLPAKGVPFTRSVEVQIMLTPDATDKQGRVLYTGHGDIFPIHGAVMTPDRPHPAGWSRCLPSARTTKGKGQWNHYRVTAERGTIRLAVNGTEVSGGTDVHPRKGYICLESEGTPIRFRNIRLTELPASAPAIAAEECAPMDAGFRSIFDGTLEGWGGDWSFQTHWTVHDWVLSFDGKGTDIWTKSTWRDFELMVDWRWGDGHQGEMDRPLIGKDGKEVRAADGSVQTAKVQERDSGIYLRGSKKSQVNIWSWPCGSGEVWGYRTDASMLDAVRASCTPRVAADAAAGQWNRFLIRMQGDVLNVWLNGQQVIDHAELPGVPREGPIGLQSHGSAIEFANLFLRPLAESTPSEKPPTGAGESQQH